MAWRKNLSKTNLVPRKSQFSDRLGGGVKYYVSESYEREWIKNAINDSKNIRLAVCLLENNLHIGNVYITDIDQQKRTGTSHIMIGNHDYWGHGYATEAYNQLLEYAFSERAFHRIVAHVLSDNIGSIKLHLKCGYVQEGIMRESVFKNGEWKDQVLFSILEKDYFSKK